MIEIRHIAKRFKAPGAKSPGLAALLKKPAATWVGLRIVSMRCNHRSPRKGSTMGPSHSARPPNSTSVIAQLCRLSLRQFHTLLPWRSRRTFSRCQAEVRLPQTLRGQKA